MAIQGLINIISDSVFLGDNLMAMNSCVRNFVVISLHFGFWLVRDSHVIHTNSCVRADVDITLARI